MGTLYKVQQHRERGWEDVCKWTDSYEEAEKSALTLKKPKTEHVRILECKSKSKYSHTYRTIFLRGSVQIGTERQER